MFHEIKEWIPRNNGDQETFIERYLLRDKSSPQSVLPLSHFVRSNLYSKVTMWVNYVPKYNWPRVPQVYLAKIGKQVSYQGYMESASFGGKGWLSTFFSHMWVNDAYPHPGPGGFFCRIISSYCLCHMESCRAGHCLFILIPGLLQMHLHSQFFSVYFSLTSFRAQFLCDCILIFI